MRVMVIVKANSESEAGVLPSPDLLKQMGKFNEELIKAGVMLAGEGLNIPELAARHYRLLETMTLGNDTLEVMECSPAS